MSTTVEAPSDAARVKGMFRVQIEENGEIVGDSGWHENLITNLGFNNFVVSAVGGIAGSSQITHLALGTGGAPVATDTVLAGEVQKRQAVTAATSSTSKTLHLTGAFLSANSFVTASQNISNIGLFGTSTTSGGTIMAGNTYASSACATNVTVNVTYDLTWS